MAANYEEEHIEYREDNQHVFVVLTTWLLGKLFQISGKHKKNIQIISNCQKRKLNPLEAIRQKRQKSWEALDPIHSPYLTVTRG
jgi:hypothetical protein